MALAVALVAGACHDSPDQRAISTTAPDDISMTGDVEYEQVGDDALTLDLYEPTGEPRSGRPAVVLIHGGGYYSGDKSDLSNAAETYAREGYVVANINYRLEPAIEDLQRDTAGGTLTPEQAETLVAAFDRSVLDSRAAVRYLKEHAGALGIAADRIATIGWSAGGSTSAGHLLTRDFDGDGVVETPDVAGAVIASGSLGDELLAQIDVDPPPAMVLAYETDTANSAFPPEIVCQAVDEQGGECQLQVRPGSGHFIDLGDAAPEVLPFLERVAPPG